MSARAAPPDEAAMATAVARFLEAAGFELGDEGLAQTPQRVAHAWAREFLNGYQADPASILAERFSVERPGERELILVSDLRFRSMCPHHLMPYDGVGHIAYMPGASVLGFGRLASLLDAFAHRLVLQETIAQSVTDALMTHLGTAGAACILVARQTCLTHRHEGSHADARAHSEAYAGVLKEPALRAELWARLSRS